MPDALSRRRGLSTVATAAQLTEEFGPVPVTISRASQRGLSEGRLRAAVAAGALTVLQPGVVVASEVLDAVDERGSHLLTVRAAIEGVPDGLACFRSARAVHVLPDPFGIPPLGQADAELLVPGSSGWRGRGFRVHGCPLTEEPVLEGGIPVTSLARTAVDGARYLPLPRALIPVDAALRRLVARSRPEEDPRWLVRDPGAVEGARAELAKVVTRMYGWPGVVGARRAVAHAHPGAESPLESLSRGVVLDGGLPAPDCGVPVLGDDGLTYWADQAWQRFRVLGEADGRLKYVDPQALFDEKRREDALRRAGWAVVRWTYDEVARTPTVVVERIARALRSGGWSPP
ncbi:MAG: DUF559 domain-containing protein [Candidatus Nanopelagicales bacterium]